MNPESNFGQEGSKPMNLEEQYAGLIDPNYTEEGLIEPNATTTTTTGA